MTELCGKPWIMWRGCTVVWLDHVIVWGHMEFEKSRCRGDTTVWHAVWRGSSRVQIELLGFQGGYGCVRGLCGPHTSVAGCVALFQGSICPDSLVKKSIPVIGRPNDISLVQIWFKIPKLGPSIKDYFKIYQDYWEFRQEIVERFIEHMKTIFKTMRLQILKFNWQIRHLLILG